MWIPPPPPPDTVVDFDNKYRRDLKRLEAVVASEEESIVAQVARWIRSQFGGRTQSRGPS